MSSKIVYRNITIPEYRAYDVSFYPDAISFAVDFEVDVDVVYQAEEGQILIQFPEHTVVYQSGTKVWAIVTRTAGIIRDIQFETGDEFEENWKDTP